MRDGGQVAITGFTLQTFIAVMESLSQRDWQTMIIEPTATEAESYEKADIVWQLKSGGERHVQVKSRSKNMTLNWAQEEARKLETESARASELVLCLVGTTSEELRREEQLAMRTTVQTVLDDETTLMRAASDLLAARYDAKSARHTTAARHRVLEHAISILLKNSGRGKPWSRDELDELLEDARRRFLPNNATSTTHEESSALIVYKLLPTGAADEFRLFSFHNPGDVALGFTDDYHLLLTFTESTHVQVLGAFDGSKNLTPTPIAEPLPSGGHSVRLPLAGVIEPSAYRLAGLRMRRTGMVSKGRKSHIWADPFLPMETAQHTRVVLILPEAHDIWAPSSIWTTNRMVVWEFEGLMGERELRAEWEPFCAGNGPSHELDAVDLELAELHLHGLGTLFGTGLANSPLHRCSLGSYPSDLKVVRTRRAQLLAAFCASTRS